MAILYYVKRDGHSPFATWYEGLNAAAFARVTAGVARVDRGNRGNVKSVGEGVHEYRIDFGPGYRVYFGIDDTELIILLGGGTKQRQQRDIEMARASWQDYKLRKRGK